VDRVSLTDVTLREYGQNIPLPFLPVFTPEIRIEIARKLIQAGFCRLEVFSCVHPTVAPAMNREDVQKTAAGLGRAQDFELITLAPNKAGYRNFLAWGLGPDGYNHTLGVFFSAVEAHNRLNLGRSIQETVKEYEGIIEDAVARKVKVAGYVSAAFGYLDHKSGETIRPSPELLNRFIDFYFDLGAERVTLSDLQGVAGEEETAKAFQAVLIGRNRSQAERIGYHPHHVSAAKAMANSRAAYDVGIRCFDASLGGTGGCVTGAPGNQPADLLVRSFEGRRIRTGIDKKALSDLTAFVQRELYTKIPLTPPLEKFSSVITVQPK
jgi:hydroxymethylglutaryl-CoA lyase